MGNVFQVDLPTFKAKVVTAVCQACFFFFSFFHKGLVQRFHGHALIVGLPVSRIGGKGSSIRPKHLLSFLDVPVDGTEFLISPSRVWWDKDVFQSLYRQLSLPVTFQASFAFNLERSIL